MNASKSAETTGQEVLKEAMELLNGLEFDAVNGGTARTERLFVSVIPDWEDDSRRTFRATLTCQAMWHRKVDWNLMRVSVRPQSPSGFFVQHVLPLSAEGSATFENLDAGTYVLKAYCHLVQFTTPKPGEVEHGRDSSTELVHGVAMDRDPSSEASSGSTISSSSLIDDIVVLRGSTGRATTLEFATNNDELADKTLEFCVADPDTNEIYLGEQTAVFNTTPADGEYRFRTGPIELSFSSGDDVALSYRIL